MPLCDIMGRNKVKGRDADMMTARDQDTKTAAAGTPERTVHVCHGDTVLTDGEPDSFVYTVTDPVGIHARPAGALVILAKKYTSEITVSADGKTANAASILNVMSLGAVCGTRVKIEARGEDAREALAALREYFRANL